jgi:diketogulonate reductase-like aldo/keto reductase
MTLKLALSAQQMRLERSKESLLKLLKVYQTPAGIASSVVQEAIKAGYRHVDSAAVYRNEAGSAEGLLKSGVPREQLFFTSKIPPRSMSYAGAKQSIAESLEKVHGLGYIDLMLLHSPYGGTDGRLGAWKAMAEAVEAGTIRSIGVSNYGVDVRIRHGQAVIINHC